MMKPVSLVDLFRLAGVSPADPVARHLLVTGVTESTKELEPGMIFVARKGETHDGHHFLGAAAAKGACAAVVERNVGSVDGLPCVRVGDAREALARLCDAFYGHPSRRVRLIGVTGTDGKTTTTHLIAGVLRAGGSKVAVLSSIGGEIDGERYPTENTTPPPSLLQRLLATAAERKNDYVVMEVSSHAVVQRRLAGCRFLGGVLTNVSADHLEFHPSLAKYREAKRKFFQEYLTGSGDGAAPWQVLNADDPTGRRLRTLKGVRTLLYGLGSGASLRAEAVSSGKRRVDFRLISPEGSFPVRLSQTGGYNVPNALAAAGAGLACGVSWERIREGLEAFRGVPGRFEYLECGLPFDVAIDYAHTPQAVRAVLGEGRRLAAGRLLVVFSAPGGRWVGKRAEMGRLVAESAYFAVVTSDNPGDEDPGAIARDILQGFRPRPPREGFQVELDRGRAIELALAAARPGDLLLLLGKGHEEFQLVGGRRVPFSEREVVLRFAGRK